MVFGFGTVVARFNQSQFCGNWALQGMGLRFLSDYRGLVMIRADAH